MSIYYSQATGGFYDTEIHGNQIPTGAAEISTAEHRALLDGQAMGKSIQADNTGRPILVEPPQPTAEQRRTSAKTAIDTAAGKARARYVSAGQLVEEEYRLAQQQTKDWRDAGSPSDAVPESIQDWADAAGITAEEAATGIEQTAIDWETVLLTVRQLRLTGKASVDGSGDNADFSLVAKAYIDQLDAMQP